MPVIALPNALIRYDLSGSGDPTVLIHGSLVDRRTWDSVRPGLDPSLSTVAYDRRGYGESTGAARRHPVHDDAGDLAGLLEGLDMFPVHVIAHSYGSAVALRLATDRPEMVRSLALHEPPYIGALEDDPATAPEADRLRSSLRAMRALAQSGRPEEAAREIVDALSTEEGAWGRLAAGAQRSIVRNVDRWVEEIEDPEATMPDRVELGELLIPVLLTTGERSPPYLHRIAAAVADRLRNVTFRTLPGVGHVPHVSDPNQFIAVLHGFLVERNVPST